MAYRALSRWLAVAALLTLIAGLAPSPIARPAGAAAGAAPDPVVGGLQPSAPAPSAPEREPAAQPQPPQLPPHHQPGRRSRSYDPHLRDPQRAAQRPVAGSGQAPPLDTLVANGTYGDPLQGNYTLAPRQQIALLNDTTNN